MAVPEVWSATASGNEPAQPAAHADHDHAHVQQERHRAAALRLCLMSEDAVLQDLGAPVSVCCLVEFGRH